MPSTRLFHTLVVAGAALVSAPLAACSAGSVSEVPTESSEPSQPDGDHGDHPGKGDADAEADSDAGGPDTGWAPTK